MIVPDANILVGWALADHPLTERCGRLWTFDSVLGRRVFRIFSSWRRIAPYCHSVRASLRRERVTQRLRGEGRASVRDTQDVGGRDGAFA